MPTQRRTLIPILLGLAILVLLGCATCAIAGWWSLGNVENGPPGKGEQAERGYAVSQPIIEALETYRAAEGKYPDTLSALTPDYLASLPQEVNDFPIDYRLTETSYSLEFSYTGPGMNHCSYTPETGWECYGYY